MDVTLLMGRRASGNFEVKVLTLNPVDDMTISNKWGRLTTRNAKGLFQIKRWLILRLALGNSLGFARCIRSRATRKASNHWTYQTDTGWLSTETRVDRKTGKGTWQSLPDKDPRWRGVDPTIMNHNCLIKTQMFVVTRVQPLTDRKNVALCQMNWPTSRGLPCELSKNKWRFVINNPKVAKLLAHQVCACMNEYIMIRLSPPVGLRTYKWRANASRTMIRREDPGTLTEPQAMQLYLLS